MGQDQPSWEGRQVYDGVVHLKGFLSPEEQMLLYTDVGRCAVGYNPTRARNAKSNFMKIMAYSCTEQVPISLSPPLFSSPSLLLSLSSLSPSPLSPSLRSPSLLFSSPFSSLSLAAYLLCCSSQAHLVPDSFKEFSQRACSCASQVDKMIPPSYTPTYVTSFKYAVKVYTFLLAWLS